MVYKERRCSRVIISKSINLRCQCNVCKVSPFNHSWTNFCFFGTSNDWRSCFFVIMNFLFWKFVVCFETFRFFNGTSTFPIIGEEPVLHGWTTKAQNIKIKECLCFLLCNQLKFLTDCSSNNIFPDFFHILKRWEQILWAD